MCATTNGDTAEYLTMRALGAPWNLSSFEVGKVLKENGLRLDSGNPTVKSITNGYAKAYRLDCGLIAYRWKKDVVEPLLKKHSANSK